MADKKFFIYSITNTKTGKRYIGSTVSTIGRWKTHRWQLNKGIHANEHLQRAWNKYGKKSFIFETLYEEIGNAERKRTVEDEFMNKYSSRDREFGYNLNAANLIGNVMKDETRRKISAALKNNPKTCKPVVQYNISNGELIKQWLSATLAGDELGLRQSNIAQCCSGNSAYQTVAGFGWAYADEYFSIDKKNWANSSYVPHFKTKSRARKVIAKNVITGAVLEFNSIQLAADHFGCANKYIQRGVQMSGERGRKTCKGHTWSYADITT